MLFSIDATSAGSTGDSIHAQASIVFDQNPAIKTNVWRNMLDAVAPSTYLSAMADSGSTTNYSISFNATDDAGGSGVSNLQLFMRTDSGEYSVVAQGAPYTISSFNLVGVQGATYDFYALAEDTAGNQEQYNPTKVQSISIDTTTAVAASVIRWQGNISSEWIDPLNWSPARVPTALDTALVPLSTNYPELDSGNTCVAKLVIESDASATILSSADTLEISYELIVDGQLIGQEDAYIQLGGDSVNVGTILKGSGAASIANLVATNSNGVSNMLEVHIIRALYVLDSTTFTTGNKLTLEASSTATAAIAALPSGASVVGSVMVNQFIGAYKNWRFISSPKANATLADLSDDINMYGFPGAPTTSSGTSNVWTYDAPTAQYLMPASGLSTPMGKGLGWQMYTFNKEANLDWFGAVNQGVVNYPLSGSSGSFNLVGNPYPAPIDVQSSAWTYSNIGNTIYIYDVMNNTYTSYNRSSGLATGRGSRYVALGQSFWVTATGTSPAMSSTEEVKVIQPNADFLSLVEQNTIRLLASDKLGNQTEALVALHPNSKAGQDVLDAELLLPFEDGLSLASISEGKKLVQNYIPLPEAGVRKVIPLSASASNPLGKLEVRGIETLDPGIQVSLENKISGKSILITKELEVHLQKR